MPNTNALIRAQTSEAEAYDNYRSRRAKLRSRHVALRKYGRRRPIRRSVIGRRRLVKRSAPAKRVFGPKRRVLRPVVRRMKRPSYHVRKRTQRPLIAPRRRVIKQVSPIKRHPVNRYTRPKHKPLRSKRHIPVKRPTQRLVALRKKRNLPLRPFPKRVVRTRVKSRHTKPLKVAVATRQAQSPSVRLPTRKLSPKPRVVLGHIKPRALAKQQDAQEEKRPLVQRTKPVSLKVAAWLTGVSLLGFGIYKLIQLSKHKAPVKSAVNSSNKSEAFQAQRHNQ